MAEGIEWIWNLKDNKEDKNSITLYFSIYLRIFFTLFSNEVSDRRDYIVAIWMPIIADNYSSQMFCWRKKEFLQTAGENAAVEQTIAT